ncbi:MAG: hypothetical protein WDZ76_05615 [Pseudohongiellaceae bacterium]
MAAALALTAAFRPAIFFFNAAFLAAFAALAASCLARFFFHWSANFLIACCKSASAFATAAALRARSLSTASAARTLAFAALTFALVVAAREAALRAALLALPAARFFAAVVFLDEAARLADAAFFLAATT